MDLHDSEGRCKSSETEFSCKHVGQGQHEKWLKSSRCLGFCSWFTYERAGHNNDHWSRR
jgi:hypothetical protein